MIINRNKLYSLILIACIAGYIWLYFNITKNNTENKSDEVCFIKHATNIPCPSCGSTRSIISMTKGNFIAALKINPLGYLIAAIMLITPFWILTDTLNKSKTLLDTYQLVEIYLKRPMIAIPLILLVIINWLWNISKGF